MARRRTLTLLVTLALISLIVVSEFIDVAEAKKKKKKKKKVEEPKEEESDDSSEKEKKPRKPWNQMTKEDWDRLENAPEPGDERPRMPNDPTPNVAFDPQNPTAFMKASKKGKAAMIFVTIKGDLDKKATEDVAFKHKNLLATAGVDVTPYVLENSKILWTTMDGAKGYDLIDFCMQQPEVDHVEWDQQKYYPDTWAMQKGEL